MVRDWCRKAYLSNNLLNKFRQSRIHKVSNDSHRLLLPRIQSSLHETSHILLQHGLDIPSRLLILGEDSLAP